MRITSSALSGLLILATTAALAQAPVQHGKLVGPRGGPSLSRKPTMESADDVSAAPSITPAAATVIDFGAIDFPGASDSAANFINDRGDYVGGYGPGLEVDISNSGFYLENDSFRKIQFPGAAFTDPFGLNNVGEIVGGYTDVAGNCHGFSLVGGTYTTTDFPGADCTQVDGVADSGEIVGLYYTAASSVGHGFSLMGGTYTTFDVPGAADTYPSGVNNAGDIVGEYIDSSGNYHGFSRLGGVLKTIDYPGAVYSAVFAVNEQGVVAGTYGDGAANIYEGFEHGFVYIKGEFISVDVPVVGAGATWITGINKRNEIVGQYIDTAGRIYGFTAKIAP
jgi:hypothetical protein